MSNKHWDADSPAEAAGRSTRWAGVGGAGQSVFDPLSVRGRRLRVEAEQLSLHADPGLAVAFELGPDGGVVQLLWWSRVLQLSEYPVQSGLPRIGWPGGVGAWLRRL